MGLFDVLKKKNKVDDTIKHFKCGPWEQYDVLMNTGFSWQMIVDLANYMASTDIGNIDQVTLSELDGSEDKDQTYEFAFHGTVRQMPSLKNEHAALGLAGVSKTLNSQTKIVWFNQTRVIRIFTKVDDQNAIRIYADNILKKNFGAADEKKQCAPSPQLQAAMKKQNEEFEAFRADTDKYYEHLRNEWDKFSDDDKKAIEDLIAAGNTKEAIKQCHLRTRMGLMPAKDLVTKVLMDE